jgi:hypothetical protein
MLLATLEIVGFSLNFHMDLKLNHRQFTLRKLWKEIVEWRDARSGDGK